MDRLEGLGEFDQIINIGDYSVIVKFSFTDFTSGVSFYNFYVKETGYSGNLTFNIDEDCWYSSNSKKGQYFWSMEDAIEETINR